jgi:two-component system, LytTR family, response regulator
MNYLIVDDNTLARMSLKELISQTNLLEFAGECSNGAEAYQFITSRQVDLLFLDIEMPGISGIELMKSLPTKPIIIFTSAKKNYAVDVFDLNVADYIIKPVTPARLLEAITKAGKIFEKRNATISKVEKEFIFLKDKKALKKINISDILWIEAMGDYIKIHTPEKWYMAHTSLRILEEKLPHEKFMKIHRSYIVALNKIDSIEDNIIHINKSMIPLADSCRQQLLEKLNTI